MLWIFSHGHTASPLIRGKWANDMSARASLVLQRLLLLWVLLYFDIFISGWRIHKWNSCRCATVVAARNLTFSSKTSPVFLQTSRPVSQHGGYLLYNWNKMTDVSGTDHQVWNTQPHTPATKKKKKSIILVSRRTNGDSRQITIYVCLKQCLQWNALNTLRTSLDSGAPKWYAWL